MKISVTNIGPVRKADIELAPLTIFIGPNNTGKSIIATVLYSALSFTSRDRPDSGRVFAESMLYNGPRGETANEIRAFLAELERDEKPFYDELPVSFQDFLTDNIGQFVADYMDYARSELERAVGEPVEKLRRHTGKRATGATITIASESPSWSVSINLRSARGEIIIDRPPNARDAWNSAVMRRDNFSDDDEYISLLEFIAGDMQTSMFASMPDNAKYLPAARSGILQSYKRLAGFLIRRSPFIKGRSRDETTGIVADFLAEMVALNPRTRAEFAAEADRLEHEILNGQIVLVGEPVPEVFYRALGRDYPLSRTSSMVSELAPVVLYLRHALWPGDLLFIEEPEAHLHPAAQVAFARCLVRLVNKGLRVGLTTHSEFFLEQINTTIMAGALPKDRVADLNVASEQLDANKVAAYFFEPKNSGTNVVRLPINPKEGIPNTTFDAVTEQLYNELVTLDRRIGDREEEG